MHTRTNRNTYGLGEIVLVRDFPYAEDNRSKPRYGLIVDRQGQRVTVRGIYTRGHRGYQPIAKTFETGLDHDSYVGTRRVELGTHQISHAIGAAPWDYDPFGDFNTAAA